MARPPDLDLLADLDAGLLPPERAAQVRAAALADPRSAAALDALAATRAELSGLGDPPVPSHLAARWAAALDDAAPGPSRPGPSRPGPSRLGPSRPGPSRHEPSRPGPSRAGPPRPGGRAPHRHPTRRRRRVLGSLVAVAVVVAGVLLARSDDRLSVTRVELAAVARSTVGLDDLGELTDPDRRDACLAAVGSADAEVAGGRRVTLDGEPGVLLILTTGVLGRFRVLVVDAACGPTGGSVLAELVIGG